MHSSISATTTPGFAHFEELLRARSGAAEWISVSKESRAFNASDIQQKRTDYLSELFYESDTLKFIRHDEGRVVMTGLHPEYQYNLTDHLGNVRMTLQR